ncbi:hypothetical protein RUM43_011600 [Polyplax serrata]|uniref:Uncharacterized protein n=1 Tax=Polyplax serrata TaxID=468196 RepID=A0AAN8NMC0_POLSC
MLTHFCTVGLIMTFTNVKYSANGVSVHLQYSDKQPAVGYSHKENEESKPAMWEMKREKVFRNTSSLLEGPFRLVRYDKKNMRNMLMGKMYVRTLAKRPGMGQEGSSAKALRTTSMNRNYGRYVYMPTSKIKTRGRKRKPSGGATSVRSLYSHLKETPSLTSSLSQANREPTEFPSNHNPVYSGVSDYCKLIENYKAFREKYSGAKEQNFDYGINEYLNLVSNDRNDMTNKIRGYF